MGLINTRMQPLRTRYAKALDKFELRPSRYGVFDAFVRDSAGVDAILTPDVRQAIKNSFGRTVVVPVLNAETVTIGNARSCTVAIDENTSALVTLTFATLAFGFTMYPGQHYNNDIAYQVDFDRKLQKYLYQLAATLDTLAYNTLNTYRNQVWATEFTNRFDIVANALQVAKVDQNNFYNVMLALMEIMDFYGNYNSVGNTMHQEAVRKYQGQGPSNAVNLAFQYLGWNFGYSNRITNGSNVDSTVFIMPSGTLAFENRNDPDSINRSRAGDGTIWEEVEVPIVNLLMGAHHYSKCDNVATILSGNESAAGLTASMVEGFQWSTDVCFLTAYNSDIANRANPIVKAEFLTA